MMGDGSDSGLAARDAQLGLKYLTQVCFWFTSISSSSYFLIPWQVYTRFGKGLQLVYSLHLPVEIAKFDSADRDSRRRAESDRDRDCGRSVPASTVTAG